MLYKSSYWRSWLVISCLILKMFCFGRRYSQGMPTGTDIFWKTKTSACETYFQCGRVRQNWRHNQSPQRWKHCLKWTHLWFIRLSCSISVLTGWIGSISFSMAFRLQCVYLWPGSAVLLQRAHNCSSRNFRLQESIFLLFGTMMCITYPSSSVLWLLWGCGCDSAGTIYSQSTQLWVLSRVAVAEVYICTFTTHTLTTLYMDINQKILWRK